MSNYYPSSSIKRRVSHKKKIANNYKRAVELMDLYDEGYFPKNVDEKREKKLKINYDIVNGRLDPALYDEGPCMVIDGEEIFLDDRVVEHYPIPSQVCQMLFGQNINTPFNLTVKDLSPLKHTFESKEVDRLLKEFVSMNILEPLRQQIQGQYAMANGITDMFSLTPEQQMQMQQSVDQQVVAMNPKEIIEYMQNDYKTPTAKQAQELSKYLSEKFDLKEQYHEGFVDGVAMAEAYYYVDINNDDLVFEHVVPASLEYGGSQEEVWVQNMSWAKRTRWLTLEEVFNKYGEYLDEKDIKVLDRYVTPLPGTKYYDEWARDSAAHTKMFIYDTSDPLARQKYEQQFGEMNPSTKEGESSIMRVWNKILQKYGYDAPMSSFGIREATICYKDLRKFYRIEREVDGEIIKFWYGENYEPIAEDLSVTVHWFPQVWRGIKLGNTDGAVYLKIAPLEYQYRSLDNPRDVELPFYGRKFNTHKNQADNVSFVDLAKKYAKEIDILMADIKHDLRTDLGTQFLMIKDAKPDSLSMNEWFSIMRNYNYTMIDPKEVGMDGIDLQYLFQGRDVSKMGKIAERIQLVDKLTQDLYKAMYASAASLGAAGQYTTNQNIVAQQSSTTNQTTPLFHMCRKIFEKASSALLNKARMFYKDNPDKVKHVLSPSSMIELQAGKPFWYSELGVSLENSGVEMQQVELLKNRMLEFIQNGMGVETVLELALADSKSDIINIVRRSSKQLLEQQQAARQYEAEQAQLEAQKQERLVNQELQARILMNRETLLSQEDRAVLQSKVMQLGNDADEDGEPDSVTTTKLKIASNEKIESEKRRVDMAKIDNQNQVNRK